MPLNALVIEPWLPPTSLAVIALFSLVLWRKGGRLIAAVLLFCLVLMALPAVSLGLLASLDFKPFPLDAQIEPPIGAIVILSADVVRTAIPGRTDIGSLTLERERAGAALARLTGLPVLVTGGIVTAPPPVGSLMAASMAADFGVKVQWAEVQSMTTWENATRSVPILRAAGIQRVYLVTHAWHMRRSILAFERAGMPAVPAPVRQDAWPQGDISELLPRASSWERSYFAIHEWIGLLYYGLRH